jgi:hypothetical protein
MDLCVTDTEGVCASRHDPPCCYLLPQVLLILFLVRRVQHILHKITKNPFLVRIVATVRGPHRAAGERQQGGQRDATWVGWVWGLEGRSSGTYQSCERAWEGEAAAARGQSSPWARPVCPASWSCPSWNAPENSVCTEREMSWRQQFTTGRGRRRGVMPHNTRHLSSPRPDLCPGLSAACATASTHNEKGGASSSLFPPSPPPSSFPCSALLSLSLASPSPSHLPFLCSLACFLQDLSLAAAQGCKSSHGLTAWPCGSPESACMAFPW